MTRRPDLISRASIRDYLSEKVSLAVIADNENVNLCGLNELCRAYDLGRYYIIANDHDLREKLKNFYPDSKIIGNVSRLQSENILIVKIHAGSGKNLLHSLEVKRRCLEHDGEILFLFADDESRLDNLGGIAGYIYETALNVPLNILIGTALDRLLGKR